MLATLHTTTSVQSISRIIDVFPPLQQRQAQVILSNSISGVISQRLIPGIEGRSRHLAAELMVASPAIRNLIREGKIHLIYSSIQTGSKLGMQTMENSLQQLIAKGLIGDQHVLEGYSL